MADNFNNDFPEAQVGPATRQKTLTPSNTVAIDPIPRALYVSVTGNVAIEDIHGNRVTYPSVPAHTRLDIRAKYLRTDTTATVIGWD